MITVRFLNYGGKERVKSFDDFTSLKKEVVKVLDSRGWDNKNKVDLRSINSCVDYLFEDVKEVLCKKLVCHSRSSWMKLQATKKQ